MRIDRLEQIIKAVEATPDAQFDMDTWMEKTECGTCGCAIGNFCLQNPGAEMRLVFDSDGFGYPVFADSNCLLAIAKFLEMSMDVVAHLFHPNSYMDDESSEPPTKAEVICRLREELLTPA